MAKSIWALIAEIASILKVASANGETKLRASAIDDDKDVSIAWLLQPTNKEIPKPKELNPFDRSANMSDIGKEFLEQYDKLMKSVQGKYQTLDELNAQNEIIGQILREGWAKIAGKNVVSLLEHPDAAELLTHLPIEKIKASFSTFANDSQKWSAWGLGDDDYKGWFSLSVDQYIPDALAQVMRNNRGEKLSIAADIAANYSDSYKSLIELAGKLIGESLTDDGIEYDKGLLNAATSYAQKLFDTDMKQWHKSQASIGGEEQFGEFIKVFIESTKELLTNPVVTSSIIDMDNVRGYLSHNSSLGPNKSYMEYVQRVLYGDEQEGMDSIRRRPSIFKQYSDNLVSMTQLDEHDAYRMFKDLLKVDFRNTDRLFDFGDNQSKQRQAPTGLLASAGASDVLPFRANPEMIQQKQQASSLDITSTATIDIAPAMEANDVLRAAIANPLLLPEVDGNFAGMIGEDFLSALFASPIENPEELTPYALDMLNTIFSGFSLENFEGAENIGEALHQGIAGGIDNAIEALQDEDFLSSMDVIQGMMSEAMIGIAPSQEDLARFDEAWAYITDGQSSFMESMMALSGGNAEAADGMLQSFLGLDGLDLSGLEDAKAQMLAFAESFKGIDTDFDYAAASAEELNQRGIDMSQTFGAAQMAFVRSNDAIGTLTKGQAALEKAQKGVVALSKEEQKDLDAAKKLLGYKAKGYEGLGDAIDEGIKKETMSVEKSIALMKKAHEALGENIKQLEKDPNYSPVNLEKLKAQYATEEEALEKLEAAKKRNAARRRAAEAAARAAAAEAARKEAIQKDYQMIAHKRHMNEITLEEELAMLEKIREQRKLNAEETMQWEEKVYDLKKEINARDSGSIDKMGSGVVTALSNRYQAMLDAETERLDTSREAWKTWRDDSVKAIEDQIAALDELSKTEDREKQDQEELRKIAKLRQDIEFEQDEYNRAKLQQQLEQAIESREERLKKQERDDQKDALREEIKGINERADAEIKALDDEQKTIEEQYAERMKPAALQAEAERLIMTQSQDQIISLLGEYAPEYDALGKTLGEKLLDGFKSKVSDVVSWFASLNDQLYAIQEQAAAEAISSADAFYASQQDRAQSTQDPVMPGSTVVNQTVNFNEPVETASQAARRVAEANENLGALIYGSY